ncbi:MAG TPA: F0F1 ATP synthase subunit epsilon [Dehalococcoidia bacterium]
MPLKLDIVTPERVVFSAEGIERMVVPGIEGELGIRPLHAPLMTMLQPGEMRIYRGNEEVVLAVTGGFMEVRDNAVIILADAAERAEEIDVARAEAARQRAQELLARRPADVDLAAAEAALRRALARLRVAEQRRRRGGGRPRVE